MENINKVIDNGGTINELEEYIFQRLKKKDLVFQRIFLDYKINSFNDLMEAILIRKISILLNGDIISECEKFNNGVNKILQEYPIPFIPDNNQVSKYFDFSSLADIRMTYFYHFVKVFDERQLQSALKNIVDYIGTITIDMPVSKICILGAKNSHKISENNSQKNTQNPVVQVRTQH